MTTDAPIVAGDAHSGLLVAHVVDGENVGRQIRHVEPADDDTRILLVFAGGDTAWYNADQPLPIVDRKDTQAAQQRLDRKRRRQRMIAALRDIVEVVEARDLPMPGWCLQISGGLNSIEELDDWATALGEAAEVVESAASPGFWSMNAYLGDPDRDSAPVELRFTYVDRDAQRRAIEPVTPGDSGRGR